MSGLVERLRKRAARHWDGPRQTTAVQVAKVETVKMLLTEAADTIEAQQRDLAECYRLSGADPDGDSDAMLARHAVQACRDGRKEWDECGDELIAAEKRLAEVEGQAVANGEGLVKWRNRAESAEAARLAAEKVATDRHQERNEVEAECEAALERVREALEEEWGMNHDERCDNMRGCESFGGDRPCYYSRPATLSPATQEEEQTRSAEAALERMREALKEAIGYIEGCDYESVETKRELGALRSNLRAALSPPIEQEMCERCGGEMMVSPTDRCPECLGTGIQPCPDCGEEE